MSRYPSVSHSFIHREVRALRRHGAEVHTFSVHRSSAADVLSDADRHEQDSTVALLPTTILAFARSHVRAFVRSPAGYLRTLRKAVSVSPAGLRKRLWQVFYFAEAIMLWDRAERKGLRHLHAHLTNVAADLAWLATSYGNEADSAHGWWWSVTVHGPTEFFNTAEFNLRRKLAAAHQVVCISDFCRSQVMSLLAPDEWAKLAIVHCGVDLDRYAFRPARRQPEEAFRVLCVGRLVPEKGQALLIDAVAQLVRTGIDATLTLVGSGPDEEMLRRRADKHLGSERAHLLGSIGQDDLPQIFGEHHAFCLPSFAEGVPVVLMEAMASGLPVVTSRIAGIPELIQDGVSGCLVPAGSLDALVAALDSLAGGGGAALVEQARTTIATHFDADGCATALASVFAGGPRSSGSRLGSSEALG